MTLRPARLTVVDGHIVDPPIEVRHAARALEALLAECLEHPETDATKVVDLYHPCPNCGDATFTRHRYCDTCATELF